MIVFIGLKIEKIYFYRHFFRFYFFMVFIRALKSSGLRVIAPTVTMTPGLKSFMKYALRVKILLFLRELVPVTKILYMFNVGKRSTYLI